MMAELPLGQSLPLLDGLVGLPSIFVDHALIGDVDHVATGVQAHFTTGRYPAAALE
jgi:hypothetical protein